MFVSYTYSSINHFTEASPKIPNGSPILWRGILSDQLSFTTDEATS